MTQIPLRRWSEFPLSDFSTWFWWAISKRKYSVEFLSRIWDQKIRLIIFKQGLKNADTIRVRLLFECGPYWRHYGSSEKQYSKWRTHIEVWALFWSNLDYCVAQMECSAVSQQNCNKQKMVSGVPSFRGYFDPKSLFHVSYFYSRSSPFITPNRWHRISFKGFGRTSANSGLEYQK